MKSYGISEVVESKEFAAVIAEEIRLSGYSVIEGVLDEESISHYNKAAEEVYEKQANEFGEDFLAQINEKDLARCPVAYDPSFKDLIFKKEVLDVVRNLLGSYFILSLQNCIINRPFKKHHQSSWHRDLPYQEFTSSAALGINAFYCLCDFNELTGGTIVLPGSHKVEKFPSMEVVDRSANQVVAKAGSVIFFDPMVYHRAGFNNSSIVRRGVNHLYTRAFIKQQIDLPSFLCNMEKSLSDEEKQILGFSSRVFGSVAAYRESRRSK